jgi:hypothetical protein
MPAQREKRHHFWRDFLIVIVILAIVLGVGRLMLPRYVRNYVNRTLDRSVAYSGTIGRVRLNLLRGSYTIDDVNISKRLEDVPVPFFQSKRLEFAIQWNALFHHRIVGQMVMNEPQLNFVDAPNEGESQTGTGAPWLQMIRDLFPFKINSAIVHNGQVHFRTYKKSHAVDVYLSQVEGSVDNLTNIRNESNPQVATVKAAGLIMDQAKLEFMMTLDPFSYRPTFHMALRMLGLDLTKINDLALTYGKFDFKRGWFDLVIETDSNEGVINGYVKPLFRNVKVFSLTQDIKEDTVTQFFWQALVGFTTTVFKNWNRDQFGTVIPFSGTPSGTSTDILATIGNVLYNAFVRAYLPRLQSGKEDFGGLQFSAPDITSPLSVGE